MSVKPIKYLREQRAELRNKVRELEEKLKELDDPKYFYDGERITREMLDAESGHPVEEWDEKEDAFREIGRLRRALFAIAKNDFPRNATLETVRDFAQEVLDGEYVEDQD